MSARFTALYVEPTVIAPVDEIPVSSLAQSSFASATGLNSFSGRAYHLPNRPLVWVHDYAGERVMVIA